MGTTECEQGLVKKHFLEEAMARLRGGGKGSGVDVARQRG